MNVTIPYEWGAIATYGGIVHRAFDIFPSKIFQRDCTAGAKTEDWVVIVSVIIIGLLAVNLGAYTYYNLNFNNNYINYVWTPQVAKQVAVSSWAAGADNVTTAPVTNIPQGNATTTLSLIRNWDTNSSETQSQNQIGVNYLQLKYSIESCT